MWSRRIMGNSTPIADVKKVSRLPLDDGLWDIEIPAGTVVSLGGIPVRLSAAAIARTSEQNRQSLADRRPRQHEA
jgi:hypothetical protein